MLSVKEEEIKDAKIRAAIGDAIKDRYLNLYSENGEGGGSRLLLLNSSELSLTAEAEEISDRLIEKYVTISNVFSEKDSGKELNITTTLDFIAACKSLQNEALKIALNISVEQPLGMIYAVVAEKKLNLSLVKDELISMATKAFEEEMNLQELIKIAKQKIKDSSKIEAELNELSDVFIILNKARKAGIDLSKIKGGVVFDEVRQEMIQSGYTFFVITRMHVEGSKNQNSPQQGLAALLRSVSSSLIEGKNPPTILAALNAVFSTYKVNHIKDKSLTASTGTSLSKRRGETFEASQFAKLNRKLIQDKKEPLPLEEQEFVKKFERDCAKDGDKSLGGLSSTDYSSTNTPSNLFPPTLPLSNAGDSGKPRAKSPVKERAMSPVKERLAAKLRFHSQSARDFKSSHTNNTNNPPSNSDKRLTSEKRSSSFDNKK